MRYYDLTKEDHAEILAMQLASVLRETDMSLLDLIKHPSFKILHPRSYYYSGISWAIPADNDNSRLACIAGSANQARIPCSAAHVEAEPRLTSPTAFSLLLKRWGAFLKGIK